MKTVVTNADNKVVTNKMRDQIYLRHLREVQKINNRQAQQLARDIQTYRSINQLHQKHKSYAFQWHNKEEAEQIQFRNQRMKQKRNQIRSYIDFQSPLKANSQNKPKLINSTNTDQVIQKTQLVTNVENTLQQSIKERKKVQHSLHYRYRKKREQQIEHQNQKLAKAILSQRSSYLPKINKNIRSKSVMGNKGNRQKSQASQIKQVQ